MRFFFLVSLFFLSVVVSISANEELRAVKITNVDSHVLNSDKGIADAMDFLASFNINAVLVVVWNGGYTLFPSAVTDSLFGYSIDPDMDPSRQGRDPFRTIVTEAHRNGIEVLPWYEYGFASYYGSPGEILDQYPEWALKDNTGAYCEKNGFYWMAATNPEVQDFIQAITLEAVRNYDLDGIEYSDRIPAMPVEGGYDSVTVALYKQEHNGAAPPTNSKDTNWKKWRANKMSDWFMRVRDTVKSVNPNCHVCSSPSLYPWSYEEYLQDVKTWVESGTVDNCVPQFYRTTLADYSFEVDKFLGYFSPVYKPLFISGMYLLSGYHGSEYLISAKDMIDQIAFHRSRGLMGEAYFYYEAFPLNNQLLADTLRKSWYAEPAIVPGRNGSLWRPKALVVNETDSQSVIPEGDWQEKTSAGFQGKTMATVSGAYSSMSYTMDVPFDAWFGVYAFTTASPNYSRQARYVVYSETDSSETTLDQTKVSRWNQIGTVYLKQGRQRVVKIDNQGVEANKLVMADAVMIMIDRRLSPDAVVPVAVPEMAGYKPNAGTPIIGELENYPNPFNPSTTIQYEVRQAARVSLKIFNIAGQQVFSSEPRYQAPGFYQFVWQADKFSSGVYFSVIETEDTRLTNKMLLIR